MKIIEPFMKCEYCNKKLKNKSGYAMHIKECKIDNDLRKEIIYLYEDELLSIEKVSKKLKTHTNRVRRVLGNKIRTVSESCKIFHKLNPGHFNHSDKTKKLMRKKRLQYMKDNPEKTAWRKSNMSYPEKLFYNKLKELKWDKKYLIVREKSVFPYFIDFAFINEKISVEIDGSQHNLPKRKESDKNKDRLLKEKGWRVFRVTAKEVNLNVDNVISKLIEFIGNSDEYIKFGILTNKEYNKTKKYYCKCGNEKTKYGKNCTKCGSISQRKSKRPPYIQLLEEISSLGYVGTGKKYGVSDNSIRKWVKYYEKN